MSPSISVPAAVAALALAVDLMAAQPTPAEARSAGACSSRSHPGEAATLSADIASALHGRKDTVAVGVYDVKTGLSCAVNPDWHFDSASVVKATIMAAVLRRAQELHRGLTSWERSNLHSMIVYSDNNAASRLWSNLGRTRFAAYLRLAGMTETVPGAGGYWGLTRITARDELRLLATLDGGSVLSASSRAYALGLMAEVTPDQRWGTPYGAPRGVVSHVKNGWLPRATRGWRVHSIGVFTGSGHDYRIVVLSDENPTMDYGVQTIQRVAKAVHGVLGK